MKIVGLQIKGRRVKNGDPSGESVVLGWINRECERLFFTPDQAIRPATKEVLIRSGELDFNNSALSITKSGERVEFFFLAPGRNSDRYLVDTEIVALFRNFVNL